MGVTAVLEGLLEDEIAICVKGNCYIVIPQASLDGKMSRVVRVELADGVDANKDFVGRADFCWG